MRSGTTPKDRGDGLEGEVILLKTANIQDGFVDDSSLFLISSEIDRRMSNTRLRGGDVLINIVGATLGVIGRVAPLSTEIPPINITQAMALIRITSPDFLPYYVSTFLLTGYGKGQVHQMARPMGQYNINLQELQDVQIVRLPIEQQRVIQKLVLASMVQREQSKSLYAEAEALLLAELGLDDLDLSHQPTYTQGFSQAWAAGRLDSDYWGTEYTILVDYLRSRPHNSLAELATFANGATPHGANYLEQGIPFLRIQNVGENRLIVDDIVYIDKETHNELLKRSQLRPGDVLITITGRIGTSAVVPDDMPVGNINQHIVRMRLRKKQTNPYYLAAFLNSRAGRLQTEREAYGTTREALPYYCLERIVVPKAPQALQELIEAKIREAEESSKEAKHLLEKAKRRVEEMVLGG